MTTHRIQSTETDRRGVFEMIGEVIDLTAGLGIMLLPLLATALPGVILLLVLPAVLLLALVAVPAMLLAAAVVPAVLLVRTVRRRRAREVG